MVTSIVSTKKNTDVLSKLIGSCTCDGPDTGGYSGSLKRDKKPKPFALETRPTTIDPKTGERVYVDQIDPFDRPLGVFRFIA